MATTSKPKAKKISTKKSPAKKNTIVKKPKRGSYEALLHAQKFIDNNKIEFVEGW